METEVFTAPSESLLLGLRFDRPAAEGEGLARGLGEDDLAIEHEVGTDVQKRAGLELLPARVADRARPAPRPRRLCAKARPSSTNGLVLVIAMPMVSA